jgi:cytochrome c553
MKKIIVRVLGALAALLVLAILGVVVKFFVLSPASRPPPEVKAPTSAEAIERGRYLAHNVAACIACHSPVSEDKPGDPLVEGKLAGGRDFGNLPGFPGHLRAPNLSSDKESGIGNFTDGEVLRAMREGVGRDGRALFPQMPYRTYAQTLSDDDALAIIAYFRSLPPQKSNPGRIEINFPVSMFIRGAPAPLAAPPPPPPPASDKLARGNWLLSVCSCHECHDGLDGRRQKIPGREFAGGGKFPLPNGKGVAIAPNISSDKATGIGAYSDDDLRRVFDEGKGKAGRFLYIMPWAYYTGLTKEDKEALLLALRAAPPVSSMVAPSQIQ